MMTDHPSNITLTSPSFTSTTTSISDHFPSFSKLNAKAPEFIPMKPNSPSLSPSSSPGHVPAGDPQRAVVLPPPSPPSLYVPVRGGSGSYQHHPSPPHYSEQRYRKKLSGKEDQSDASSGSGSLSRSNSAGNGDSSNNNGLSDEALQKLINQAEFYFSDVNLATTDHLIKFILKDPEGFVPISVVSSFKKIKALISSNSQLAAILRNSTKLEVSEDGKKVKRVHRLTSSDMEELQARIIMAENLPDDHCHQNLMKIFSVIGGVKSIRTCLPQPANSAASPGSRPLKSDNYHSSNKLHAFVEYESVELAEKAVVELNAEDSWRNGLRIRPLLKHAVKPVQGRAKKAANEGEINGEEVSVSTSESNQNEKLSEHLTAEPGAQSPEHGDEQSLDKDGGLKKSRARGKGKGRGSGSGRGHTNNNNHHHQNNRGSQSPVHGEQPVVAKQPPGPRMPDGTRGFSMGRGKPLAASTS